MTGDLPGSQLQATPGRYARSKSRLTSLNITTVCQQMGQWQLLNESSPDTQQPIMICMTILPCLKQHSTAGVPFTIVALQHQCVDLCLQQRVGQKRWSTVAAVALCIPAELPACGDPAGYTAAAAHDQTSSDADTHPGRQSQARCPCTG